MSPPPEAGGTELGAGALVYGDRSTQRAWRSGPEWFNDHYQNAAQQVIDFMSGDGIELAGRQVADIGCGDGIIDLGVVHKAAPARLVGFDIEATDVDQLLRMAAAAGVADALPGALEFKQCGTTELPAAAGEFDAVISWSAFEHIADPVAQLREIRRVLRDDGVLMIQLWPFYHSEHGSHLWGWYPDGFAQFVNSEATVEGKLRGEPFGDPDWAETMLEIFHTLNRVTVDDLQRSLLASDFFVAKLELMTNPVHIPVELAAFPLSQLGIAGVKLLAKPI